MSGTEITEDGEYTLIVTDAYGNRVTVTFTIDQTAPTGSIVISNGDGILEFAKRYSPINWRRSSCIYRSVFE